MTIEAEKRGLVKKNFQKNKICEVWGVGCEVWGAGCGV